MGLEAVIKDEATMNTMTPRTVEVPQLPEELTRMLTDANGVAERFVRGFIPAMDAKYKLAVKEVITEEFPQLLDDPAFIKRVLEAMGPEAVVEQPFVFLSKNPDFAS